MFTPSRCDDGFATPLCVWCMLRAAASDRGVFADALCNSRRGTTNNEPQTAAATPRRLPPVLWFRRAPPFSGDTVHPRRHTGDGGFLQNIDNQSRTSQTRNQATPFRDALSQVTNLLPVTFR
jgi:hypothetical protein